MTHETSSPNRRMTLGLLTGSAVIVGTMAATATLARAAPSSIVDAGLEELTQHLAVAPRRRAFKTVPFLVTSLNDWDHEAAAAVLAYRNRSLQVWECTDIAAPWLGLMREAINGQVFALHNHGFLAVAAVHGIAHLALFDDAVWDKYNLAAVSEGKAKKNTFVVPKSGTAPSDDLQDVNGYYGPENNNIRTLQERGAVFIACHDSIHAIARMLRQRTGASGPSADVIAADLTNHLIPDAILVPSVVAFLVELQRVGFTYTKGD
jgi:hypothetical protein